MYSTQREDQHLHGGQEHEIDELTGMKSSHKNLSCDQLGPDSGFLSGVLTTEDDLQANNSSSTRSSIDMGHHNAPSSSSHNPAHNKEAYENDTCSQYQRLDSGVDVSMSMSLSGLNLSSSTDVIKEESESTKSSSDAYNNTTWESYFGAGVDSDGDTQLHLTILQGLMQPSLQLISLAPSPSLLNLQNDLGQSPLHLAILTSAWSLVRCLTVAGASIAVQDLNGNTPLHLAANMGDVQGLAALTAPISSSEASSIATRYNKGQVVLNQMQGTASIIDLYNYDGQAPIHLATLSGSVEVIKRLAWLGANVNLGDGKGGRTPLHYAIQSNNTSRSKSSMSSSTTNNTLSLIQTLIEAGSHLEAINYNGLTPYQLALTSNSMPIAQILLKAGAKSLSVPNDDEDEEIDSDSCCHDEDDEDDDEEMQQCSNVNNAINNFNQSSSIQQVSCT